jgi:hypothetical protein
MRAALAVIGVIIILILFGTMMGGITAAQTAERTDTFAAVATGGGVVEADVVLVADPFNSALTSVTSITSNEVLDAPLPDAYVAGTNTLTVRGLNPSDTRTLTVTYLYGALTGTAASTGTFLGLVPIFVAIAALLILIGAGFAVYSSRGG